MIKCTWSGYNDVRISSQLSELSLHGISTHQDSSAKICVATELLDNLVGLQGKFPGWG